MSANRFFLKINSRLCISKPYFFYTQTWELIPESVCYQIVFLHISEPLERLALLNFRIQQASNPLSNAVLGLIREVTFNSDEDNYKGLFL